MLQITVKSIVSAICSFNAGVVFTIYLNNNKYDYYLGINMNTIEYYSTF